MTYRRNFPEEAECITEFIITVLFIYLFTYLINFIGFYLNK